ncbi:MAG: rhodanese-like domain-containing protein [Thermodesulfobacteriota bacterium]
MANSITPEELRTLMDSDKKTTVLDVRRKADFEASPKKIGGAEWCNPEKVDEWSVGIPQDTQVVLYCVKGGSVSQSIADRLQQDHPDVRFVQGGIKAWAELGEPLED